LSLFLKKKQIAVHADYFWFIFLDGNNVVITYSPFESCGLAVHHASCAVHGAGAVGHRHSSLGKVTIVHSNHKKEYDLDTLQLSNERLATNEKAANRIVVV
jgi:hypothetical protein